MRLRRGDILRPQRRGHTVAAITASVTVAAATVIALNPATATGETPPNAARERPRPTTPPGNPPGGQAIPVTPDRRHRHRCPTSAMIRANPPRRHRPPRRPHRGYSPRSHPALGCRAGLGTLPGNCPMAAEAISSRDRIQPSELSRHAPSRPEPSSVRKHPRLAPTCRCLQNLSQCSDRMNCH